MNEFEVYQYANGLRLMHRQVWQAQVSHCGFVLDTGTRDEPKGLEGIAHFWEHMAFKGTGKRSAWHIINRMESVGGELNAYTTKEKICVYASFLPAHYKRAVELLTDIVFNSVFPPKEIDKERQVILEEMVMYADSAEESIHDELDALVFDGHPLATNILGTSDSVGAIMQKDFLDFLSIHLNLSHIVFASTGPESLKDVRRMVDGILAELTAGRQAQTTKRKAINAYKPKLQTCYKPINQAHCVWGSQSFGIKDPKRRKFFLLSNLLGGPAMNARLNLILREKFGLVYAVETSYTPYSDTGLFSIYFSCDPKHLNKCQDLIAKQFMILKQETISSNRFLAMQKQLEGQLIMAEEGNLNLMLSMAKSLLDLGYIETLQQVLDEIRQTKPADLQELAIQTLNADDFCKLIYLPE